MDGIHIVYIFLFLFCLLAAGFFCSAETAFFSLQKLRLEHLKENAKPGAKIAQEIISQPGKFLATVLLGINFFETGVATLGTLIAINIWEQNLGTAIATVVITVITLIFAEYIPKSVGARFSERLALLYARPIQVIGTVLYPFVFVLNHIGIRFTGVQAKDEVRPTLSEEEFHTAIHIGTKEGVVEASEAEMLHKIFEFTDRPVREIMTPRTEIVWVEKGTTLAEFLEIFRESTHSRFPLYEGTTDNVVGVLYIKDVLKAQADSEIGMDSPLDDLARPPFFVPESKPMGALLSEMKRTSSRVALIVDEYGGIAGIVTIDQLIEEIVGEIGDELEEREEDIVTIDANTYQLDGTLRIEDANEELDLGLPEGDYETVAGFILSHLGRIPRKGEHLRYKNLKLAVLEMEGNKIERILVTREDNATAKN